MVEDLWLADAAAAQRRQKHGRGDRGRNGGGDMLQSFPLLLIPVAVYNVMAWGGQLFGSGADFSARLAQKVLSIPMVSMVNVKQADGSVIQERAQWIMTTGDLLLILALILLFMELLKSTSSGRQAIINHSLSMILFIVCLIEFLLFPAFATSIFFLILVMTLLDVLAGFIVTIVTARRDVALGGSE